MDKELIYGEISVKGMKQFAKLEPNCEKFMDVGSGYGKFTWVMGSFLKATQAYGIEIDPVKFKISRTCFGGKLNPNIHLEFGDFRNFKPLIKQMDVIYCNCITWKYESVIELVNCLSSNSTFYHNHIKFYGENKESQEPVLLDMDWKNGDYYYYKLNTNIER